MRIDGNCASGGGWNGDSPPLPIDPAPSGRSVVTDLKRAHAWRSPITLQPLTAAQERALVDDTAPAAPKRRPRRSAPARARRVNPDAKFHQLTPDEAAAIVGDYQSGRSMAAIAKEIGRSDCTVRNAVLRAGVPLRGQGRHQPPDDAEKARICEAYRSEGTVHAAAKATGHAQETVRKTLREAGITVRARVGQGLTPAREEEILRLWAEGLMLGEVVRQTGHGARTVRKVLRAHGHTDTGRARGGHNAIDNATLAPDVRRLYTEQGMSLIDVARALHVGRKKVAEVLDVYGIPRHEEWAGPRRDGSTELKEQLARAGITSGQVRAWARATGRPCPDRGLVPALLVVAYLTQNGANR